MSAACQLRVSYTLISVSYLSGGLLPLPRYAAAMLLLALLTV
eukprot:CAMPEP_0202892560 /NCGR_PEP_ID=MMETSP1392-20130828/2278_1 /ASSEMBLY_ACC=CAM_ASM_000868 /TAXON_ID=225041 /ORGANISM="Chlamydomonas chlamydogama, Strain SAG 11-48b" /LENGTH=41 /DNA_ID= /DNA_START= /DNA_END= /DNA_ORIENTATION=